MKAVLIAKANRIAIGDVPRPEGGDYFARVRLVAGSICNSTDRKLLDGTFPGCTDFPAILGHEAVGEVIETGAKVRNYRVGDFVIRPRAYAEEQGVDIREYFGSFVDEALVWDKWAAMEDDPSIEAGPFGHPQQVLPPGTDPQVGVLSITLKETLSWIKRLGVGQGSRVLVFGTGPVGAAFALHARLLGAEQVVLAGRTPSSIERAAAICRPTATADVRDARFVGLLREVTGGAGFDKVVEGVGDNSIIDMGIECLSEDGTLGIYGIAPSSQGKARHAGDARVKVIDPDESEVHEELFGMIAEGRIDPFAFATHRLPWDRIEEGFGLLADRSAFKVLLDW